MDTYFLGLKILFLGWSIGASLGRWRDFLPRRTLISPDTPIFTLKLFGDLTNNDWVVTTVPKTLNNDAILP